MKLTGRIIEIGTLEGEGGQIGIVIDTADAQLITIKGLTEDQARAVAPSFMDVVTLQVIASGATA